MNGYWWIALLILINAVILLLISLYTARDRVKKHTQRLNRVIHSLKQQEDQMSIIYNNAREFLGLIEIKEDKFLVRKLPDWFITRVPSVEFSGNDIYGLELKEFFRKVLQVPETEAEFLMSKMKIAADSGERVQFEGKNHLYPGNIVDSLLIPVKVDHAVTHILYVTRDITKERQWQKNLRESEEKMRLAVQNIPVMIDAFDKDGRLVVWNNSCEEITGYSAEEMTARDNPFELLYPDPEYRAYVDKLYKESKRSFNEETIITCKNGKKRIIQWIHRADNYPIAGWSDWGVGIDVTKRRKAENSLRKSEQQLSSMMHNLPGMAWRLKIDKDFTVLYVSKGAKDLLGIEAAEVLEKNILPKDLILPEYLELARQETMNCVKEMRSGELVIPIRAGDKVKWVLDRFKPTRLSNEEIVMDGLLIDISDSLENEQRLQLAIEGAREGMWDWDIADDKIKLNQYAADMLGLDNRIITKASKLFFENIHRDDAEYTRNSFLKHFKGDSDFVEKEYRIRSYDGKWKWILTRGRVMERDRNGKAIRAMGTNINIDDRKKAEIALKNSESRLVGLMANLPGMVYHCKNNRNWDIVLASPGALELTGYSPEEFLSGRIKMGEIIHPSDRNALWEIVQTAIQADITFTLTYRIITNDGTIKWVWERGSRIPESDLLEGFITDITDRVKAEERVLHAVISTENTERERIAKELHDSLGQKLTTASLNLHSIPQETMNEKNLKQLKSGLGCLEDAMQDSRTIAHNLMPRSIGKFGLVPSIESMLAELESGSPIQFKFYNNLNINRLPNSLEVNIYRILQESINNIIRHSEAKNVSIQIMRYPKDLILTIEDDGKGFSVEDIQEKGKSFGLDSMRNRANSLKGTMNIESSGEAGTLLTFEIPLDEENTNNHS